MPDPKQEEGLRPPPHPPHPDGSMPSHMLRILLELTEKVGKLEGMMEILLKQREKDD